MLSISFKEDRRIAFEQPEPANNHQEIIASLRRFEWTVTHPPAVENYEVKQSWEDLPAWGRLTTSLHLVGKLALPGWLQVTVDQELYHSFYPLNERRIRGSSWSIRCEGARGSCWVELAMHLGKETSEAIDELCKLLPALVGSYLVVRDARQAMRPLEDMDDERVKMPRRKLAHIIAAAKDQWQEAYEQRCC